MLPMMKTKALAAVTVLALAASAAAPAHAWGKKEQGFVAGALTAIIIDELIDNNKHRNGGGTRYVEPRYVEPRYVEPSRPVYREPSYRSSSVYSTPAAQAFNSYSKAERRAIQRSLRSYGYYRGGIDGSFGPGTYNALNAYARAAGVPGHMNSAGGVYALFDGLIY